ncbi:hypothetical protein HBI81_244110 [Parastagonospora nodorum]|nr:hypothetical protein HBI73_239550 [Parastagonospora nodorum]KAH6511170.1 hypothetical protein HBI81_244110 [Parastagonospora nodorum]
MPGCVDDFTSLAPKQSTITVAGGIKLPVEEMGSVGLSYRLPDGSTKTVELTIALYSSELYSTQPFYWSYIRHRGLTLFGKGNDLYLALYGAYLLSANHKNGVLVKIQTGASPAPRTRVLAHEAHEPHSNDKDTTPSACELASLLPSAHH